MGGGPTKDYVLIAVPFPETKEILDHFRQKFSQSEFHWFRTSPRDVAREVCKEISAVHWKSVTVLVTYAAFPDPADAPNLRLVQLASAGSNQIHKHPIFTDTDIAVTTSSGIHGPQIAEWVIMTGLVASHRYRRLYEFQKKHEWAQFGGESDYGQIRDKVGQRIGILGYGSIGRQVGRVAQAMGMEVVAFTATPKDTAEKRKDAGFIVPGTGDVEGTIPVEWYSGLDKASLRHFLSQNLDWLVVAVPLTQQTLHFLSTEEFKALSEDGKRPAYVTNIARGPINDQPALIQALKDGTVAGAALDVTDPEPLPSDSELWDLPNVIVTPHISGSGSSYVQRAFKVFEINLTRLETGERLLNEVSRKKGY